MDYLTHTRALEAIVRTVEQDVIGRIDDAYARSQLWTATGILANIARELAADAAGPDSASPPRGHDSHSTGAPGSDDFGTRASTLLEGVRGDVAAQRSLHYRKATTGAK
ncbi:hypothetical protein [Nocardia brevicatena]|uniref:hypothetical protein n=1 Tax=Nocardia brevicatena TaxID=37327 RepID=UPI0003159CD7|nr:hypothetical protein [Nocardia brevicatena]